MGIPYYFYYLTKKYKGIIIDKLPANINIYAIDFNGIIHPEAAKETEVDKLYLNLWNKIKSYDVNYKPNKLLICIDGVAPVAKIIQQRKRRYLSIYKNKIDKIVSKFDTNAISVGTEFMNNLDDYIRDKITSENKTSYILDGSKNAGEGEHKIFNHLLEYDNKLPIIINGLDADLIILSLISNIDNIYLMRDNNNTITYVSIDNLKQALLDELQPKWVNLDKTEIIESYCVMCSILGNDFIPHICTLNMKNNGLNVLINITTNAINSNGGLVSNNTINQKCLAQIFTSIAETEDIDIIKEVSKFKEKKPCDFTLNSQEYGIKNKDKLLDDIYNNNNKWRYYYYKSLFDINVNYDSSIISAVICNYIKGIYWTYNYYKKIELNYKWFYPYNFPPTAKDISNYLTVNEIEKITNTGTFLDPNIQLLLILPIQSNHLLNFNENLKSYTTDISKGFKHLFPKEFKIQSFLKTHLHECYPILPIINIDKITKINNV
jgi:5'-3' exonuclease